MASQFSATERLTMIYVPDGCDMKNIPTKKHKRVMKPRSFKVSLFLFQTLPAHGHRLTQISDLRML